jgi:serine protease Do
MQGFQNFDMMNGNPRLGVEIQDLDGDLGAYFNRPDGKGALVTRVLDDTPAKRAGLHSGDVIIELDGQSIADTDDLRSHLADRSAGPMRVTVLRHGTRQTLTANLEERRGAMSAMPRSWIMNRDGHPTAPRAMSDREREDLRRQMDDLRKQMDELKKEMDKDDGKD